MRNFVENIPTEFLALAQSPHAAQMVRQCLPETAMSPALDWTIREANTHLLLWFSLFVRFRAS
jgi:hypothetical protein